RRYSRWLEGGGFVSLHTDPPGAEVEVLLLQPSGRRLREQSLGFLGHTPLREVPLPMGSYVLRLRHPLTEELRYPVQIRRMEHWDGVPPGERVPLPIRLPRRGELPPGLVVVPGGWTTVGRDRQALFVHPGARIWVDTFVMDQRPLCNRRLLAMLDRLEREGRGEEIRLPRAKAGAAHYARGEAGWERVPDGEGDVWALDWPVFSVDWWDAVAVADWRAGWEGRPWRLPSEWEREKAARGVDGRFFPWGDSFDPSFCWMRESHRGRPLPRGVGEDGLDISPYGIRDLAGNIRDWCWEKAGREGEIVEGHRLVLPALDPGGLEPRMIRGGSWLSPPGAVRSASRQNARPTERSEAIGIRHVYSWG
ncbi:MAG TPA: SUMF1/EgtB/PvdO family nonheme iron enzyme, partial [Myxococcota bacterium]|nr:SUMF1/EgtB/PvdO family nonheme iron enzyme [Myxococcota bacterium]